MNISKFYIKWTSIIRWLAFTLTGMVVGLVVFIAVGILLGEAGEEAPPVFFGLVLGTIFGSVFGTAQWLYLRRYLQDVLRWIPVTIISFAVAASIILGLLNPESLESSVLLRIVHSLVAGLFIGFGQWLILRTKLESSTNLWLLFSIGSWIIGELSGIGLERLLVEPPLPLMATFLLGMSLPGIGLIWLLRRQVQEVNPKVAPLEMPSGKAMS